LSTHIFRRLFHSQVNDLFSGYVAFNRKVVDELKGQLISKGFELETELQIKFAKEKFRLKNVPIAYKRRIGKQKINGLRVAPVILWTALRNI